MHSYIRPHSHVILRLPSGTLKVLEIIPNTAVSIGKFGAFPANLLIGRPYYLTFEIIDRQDEEGKVRLRVVPASELNAEVLSDDTTPSESRAEPAEGTDGSSFDIVADDGSVLMKNNRLTVDDTSRQTLSMEEIEELKKAGTGSGKEIIERIMKAHANLDEKTAFSLAKYTLRKAKKYMRRFTVLPMDVGTLTEFMLSEKEASRIMEIREETLGLITAWSNVHYGGSNQIYNTENGAGKVGGGRWLVVDETGGLLVAALAERMGTLYADDDAPAPIADLEENDVDEDRINEDASERDELPTIEKADESAEQLPFEGADKTPSKPGTKPTTQAAPPKIRQPSDLAQSNTIHLLHANAQPNLSLLKHFSYNTNNPDPSHPLHTHLKSLSWLQLLKPEADVTYAEPEKIPASVLDTWKSSKRGTYFKKRRRWERCRSIVDETRAGGFDGLLVASVMEPATILKHTVPLLRGSGHVVVFSPTIEPLTNLMDLYSRDRKAAYLQHLEREGIDGVKPSEDDFPVDPRLLLAPTLQTSRVKPYQVLPGRTHPVMTMRGSAEGYVFTARRVLPVQGKVEARGNFAKKRKVE